MRTVRRSAAPGAAPVHTAVPVPGSPPIGVVRIEPATEARIDPDRHAHDFPGLLYVEGGHGAVDTGGRTVPVGAGDLLVIAPGDVIAVHPPDTPATARGWGVFFLPEALRAEVPAALLSWRAHPLLFPFARGGGRALRLSVPDGERPDWVTRIAALDEELNARREGFREAATAHLVLLLVGVARLAQEVGDDLLRDDEPLLAEVFAVIERGFRGPLSLRDVARAVTLSPGHLTTTVRRRTGRTVQEWIAERRMAQARTLLSGSALSVDEVARAVGVADPSYFARLFRRAHGVSPREWRRAGRAAGSPRGGHDDAP